MILFNLSMKARRIVFFWLPPVLWMGLIYFLSSFHKLQASPVSWQDFIIRKTAHFLEYFILYLLFYRALKNSAKLPLWKIFFAVVILTVIYALTDEYHQTFINGRTGRMFDVGVDSLGIIAGLIFSRKTATLLPEKIRKTFSI